MKAIPMKRIDGAYVPCENFEATHLRFRFHNEDWDRILPVQISGSRAGTENWSWNGDTEKPTVKPSILTDWGEGKKCHVWLNDGVVQHLGDCTCGFARQSHPLDDIDPED